MKIKSGTFHLKCTPQAGTIVGHRRLFTPSFFVGVVQILFVGKGVLAPRLSPARVMPDRDRWLVRMFIVGRCFFPSHYAHQYTLHALTTFLRDANKHVRPAEQDAHGIRATSVDDSGLVPGCVHDGRGVARDPRDVRVKPSAIPRLLSLYLATFSARWFSCTVVLTWLLRVCANASFSAGRWICGTGTDQVDVSSVQ